MNKQVVVDGQLIDVGRTAVLRDILLDFGKLLVVRAGRLAAAFIFVFLSLLLVAPFLATKLGASDHLASLTYTDKFVIAGVLTVLFYVGFVIFRITTRWVDHPFMDNERLA